MPAEKNWRAVRASMEHERYQWLRERRHTQRAHFEMLDDEMRRQAFEYASEACRLAIARESRG